MFSVSPRGRFVLPTEILGNTLNQIIFYFYLFFLSVLGISSGAEQKNLGERGVPNKALRRVKGRRAPFPLFSSFHVFLSPSPRVFLAALPPNGDLVQAKLYLTQERKKDQESFEYYNKINCDLPQQGYAANSVVCKCH